MKPNLLKLAFLFSAGFFLMSGCGGGGTDNGGMSSSPERAIGSISTLSSSMVVALDAAFPEAATTSSAIKANMEREDDQGEDNDDQGEDSGSSHFNNCAFIENMDGSSSITCDCRANGVAQGTVTHTFDNSFTRDTCLRVDGTAGVILAFDGTGTTTFDQCLVERCNQTFTLDGQVFDTVSHFVNTCERSAATTVDFSTANECSGLTITDGLTTSTVGITVTLARIIGSRVVSGTICIDNVSTDFTSLEELRSIVDPTGMCVAEVEHEDHDVDED